MAFTAGTRLGPYEILAPLGAGGMGEVYRAADTRLNRTVAIKVLRAAVADNPDRRQRFEREARAVSCLAHAHICALYDVGREHDVEFLVMEFVDGDTLDRRLVTGPLPLASALRYSVEIADALDHAHRRGIVHRDLKPANIMVTRSGVKLLDFGLAKSRTEDVLIDSSSSLATPTKTLTGEGVILGTLSYMAPEQLEGRAVDARTDLFSFGAVLYEMLTARKAFDGQSQASVIAAVPRADPPPPSSFQPLMPAALDRLVRKCVAKDPDDRWQTARDVMSELQWIQETGGQTQISGVLARGQPSRKKWIAWTVLLILFAALASLTGFLTIASRRIPPDVRPITFVVSPPEGTTLPRAGTAVVVAPDGHRLAFLAARSGIVHVWVRTLESLDAHELPETDGAHGPFWSPDSRSLAFFSGGSLKRVDVAGGRPQILCESGGSTGAWSGQGDILFDANDGLSRVSASGGAVAPVTRLDRSASETRHDSPQFLPDGRHFLYVVSSSQADRAGLYVGSLDSADRRRLGGNPGGVVRGETFSWWKRVVEENPSSIIVTAHHYVLKNTTVASGEWEGMRRGDDGTWKPRYHGYYPEGTPQGASYLYWVDSKPDPGAFESVLAKTPVDLWLGAHTHTDPDDTYGGKSHIERRWGTTFINVAHLTRYHPPPLEHRVPRSWLLTFTEGSDEVRAQCYLHSNEYASQGWYAKVERIIRLSKPFRIRS